MTLSNNNKPESNEWIVDTLWLITKIAGVLFFGVLLFGTLRYIFNLPWLIPTVAIIFGVYFGNKALGQGLSMFNRFRLYPWIKAAATMGFFFGLWLWVPTIATSLVTIALFDVANLPGFIHVLQSYDPTGIVYMLGCGTTRLVFEALPYLRQSDD
ncbi:MAG: hypothetical protein AAGC93_18450 [Cyanobacteria bacterium P01_F01_bin.53]